VRTRRIAPIHPGVTLKEDFLDPLNLSMNQLAIELRVPATRIADIVKCRRSITAETALRLGRYFGTTAQFWMNLQANYEIETASDLLEEQIARQVKPRSAA
jgi:antitoxin HigA-1